MVTMCKKGKKKVSGKRMRIEGPLTWCGAVQWLSKAGSTASRRLWGLWTGISSPSGLHPRQASTALRGALIRSYQGQKPWGQATTAEHNRRRCWMCTTIYHRYQNPITACPTLDSDLVLALALSSLSPRYSKGLSWIESANWKVLPAVNSKINLIYIVILRPPRFWKFAQEQVPMRTRSLRTCLGMGLHASSWAATQGRGKGTTSSLKRLFEDYKTPALPSTFIKILLNSWALGGITLQINLAPLWSYIFLLCDPAGYGQMKNYPSQNADPILTAATRPKW